MHKSASHKRPQLDLLTMQQAQLLNFDDLSTRLKSTQDSDVGKITEQCQIHHGAVCRRHKNPAASPTADLNRAITARRIGCSRPPCSPKTTKGGNLRFPQSQEVDTQVSQASPKGKSDRHIQPSPPNRKKQPQFQTPKSMLYLPNTESEAAFLFYNTSFLSDSGTAIRSSALLANMNLSFTLRQGTHVGGNTPHTLESPWRSLTVHHPCEDVHENITGKSGLDTGPHRVGSRGQIQRLQPFK